ncbi:MAG TPA: hypothetical protein VGM54_04385 [Chthoniobacter sp.]
MQPPFRVAVRGRHHITRREQYADLTSVSLHHDRLDGFVRKCLPNPPEYFLRRTAQMAVKLKEFSRSPMPRDGQHRLQPGLVRIKIPRRQRWRLSGNSGGRTSRTEGIDKVKREQQNEPKKKCVDDH